MQKLKSLDGAQFDVAYAKAIEKDHDHIIDLLNRATHTEGLSTDLQTFAERAMPACKTHERMSDDLKHREVDSE
jgi:predicted outer membrane protein